MLQNVNRCHWSLKVWKSVIHSLQLQVLVIGHMLYWSNNDQLHAYWQILIVWSHRYVINQWKYNFGYKVLAAVPLLFGYSKLCRLMPNISRPHTVFSANSGKTCIQTSISRPTQWAMNWNSLQWVYNHCSISFYTPITVTLRLQYLCWNR